MAGTPDPTDGGNQDTWDPEADKDCKDKTLPANASSYNTANCKIDGCTKDVKIKGGKIVGYSDSDYNQAQTLECSNSINSYISNKYNGGSVEISEEEYDDYDEDFSGCTGTKYICNYNEHSEASYENCKIEDAISACKRDLENKRLTATGEITVSGAGLPPCGRKYWVCDSGVYETTESYEDAGCTLPSE